MAETVYYINFTRSKRKLCLNRHYNRSNSFLFINSIKTYRFKAKISEIKPYSLCLENNSIQDFKVNSMKKQY